MKGVYVKVGGEYACFTRPEFKVERVTYPVMTPSAARGILEAIYWKPEFRWEVREIQVLREIRETSILRNEISSTQSKQGGAFFIEDRRIRIQRTCLMLRDVEYIIHAEVVQKPYDKEHPEKHISCFKRRVKKGQCHHRPYLGTREFDAWFEPPTGEEVPVPFNQQVGNMLFDLAFQENPDRKEMSFLKSVGNKQREVNGCALAIFFNASIENGRLIVPKEKYQQLYELERNYA
ncbi:MAG: type I-C CRISPR-associated protein Cas5 [Deltaproteobacteria bacterium]|nr:type I-C CRISPR-associated protein Cas5 [Deltaproteobacteria bacterium]